jgi:hypothetical protein
MDVCLFFLQEGQFRILPCTVDHISFTGRAEGPVTTYPFTKLCICQKFIKSFGLYGHHLALFVKFIFNVCFQTEFLSMVRVLCVLLFVDFVLLVVDFALFSAFVCGKQCCTYIRITLFQ